MPTEADLENDNLVRAYHTTFGSQDAQAVLTDLVNFCCAAETSFHPDPAVLARNEGRREVWLRIIKYSSLMPQQAVELQSHFVQGLKNRVNDQARRIEALLSGEDDG
jgi:hypothetical protein